MTCKCNTADEYIHALLMAFSRFIKPRKTIEIRLVVLDERSLYLYIAPQRMLRAIPTKFTEGITSFMALPPRSSGVYTVQVRVLPERLFTCQMLPRASLYLRSQPMTTEALAASSPRIPCVFAVLLFDWRAPPCVHLFALPCLKDAFWHTSRRIAKMLGPWPADPGSAFLIELIR